MSADYRLQTLEQLVTVTQSEAISARTPQRATEAETRVHGVRGQGVVDTRLLGKPENFDGTTDNWRLFKFTFLGYVVAVDSRLNQACDDRKRSVAGKRKRELSLACQRDKRVSTQLYHMLVLLLEDQRNACWNMQAMVKDC